MNSKKWIVLLVLLGLLMSSCSAIPTLPPPESTVVFKTPRITYLPGNGKDSTPTAQIEETEEPDVSATPTVETSPAAETQQPTIKPSSTLLPTSTATEVPTETAAPTDQPTETPSPTATKTPTEKPTFTPTATDVPYRLQVKNPLYLSNFVHEDLGCSWLGVAGQIFDKKGSVVKQVVIRAGGEINGQEVSETTTMPITDPENDLGYGPGGYELVLGDSPAASEGQVWVQLYSLSGAQLSEKIYLTTYDDCQKNLILVNFLER